MRWRTVLMLVPALIVLVGLFGGGLFYSVLQSLGWQPAIGAYDLSLDAYGRLLFGAAYAETFWSGLGLSLWISLASTLVSAILAVVLATTIHATTRGTAFWSFILQFNLPIPHLVAAIGILFLLSQSGLLARGAAGLGFITTPGEFPIWVRDSTSIGIILTYVWKETPFIAVIVLAVLKSLGESYEDAARNLGANRWQRFRFVTLPLIAPSLLSSGVLVFAFTFGSYEIPALLGVRYPRVLPVTALQLFTDSDLNARPQAMALSILISLIVTVFVVIYLWLKGRLNRV